MDAAPRTDLSSLPSMSALLAAAETDDRLARFSHESVKFALAEAVTAAREQLLRHDPSTLTAVAAMLASARNQLEAQQRQRLATVINATGIVLHTGLGRAPLSESAVQAVTAAAGYCNLEFDMDSGDRGHRAAHPERLLCRLTGAESALVVNNNAAATLLVLSTLARGREVLVSRGQLVEIGGSYRLPDVMACSGCTMVEVGTTNKTRLDDYAQRMGPQTAAIMRVHCSNFRVVGFTATPDIRELVQLARRADPQTVLVYDDLGSGALHDDALWREAEEPTVQDSVRAGADVVSFSGDKLLGGPQAGLIIGRQAAIDQLRRHPLARALRVDKLTIAALEATLEAYATPIRAEAGGNGTCKPPSFRDNPTLELLHQSKETLHARADALCALLGRCGPTQTFAVSTDTTFAGGGSLPAWPLPTSVVRWTPPAGSSVNHLAASLRRASPPVVPRIADNRIVFDARTIRDTELNAIANAVAVACRG